MLEKILQSVTEQMMPYLTNEQLDRMKDVLYISFHNIEVKEEHYEIQPAGMGKNEIKIKMFLVAKKATNRTDKTLKSYKMEICNLLNFLRKDIEDITAMDLRYYFGYLREKKHIKTSTMQTKMHCFSSFWDFLNTEELVKTNPVKKLGNIKIEKEIKKPFSAEEMEALRTSCANKRDRAIIEFLYSTGVRVSELTALNICDVDMVKQELIVYGKGSKERKTYLTDTAKFYLKRYLHERFGTGQIISNEPLFASLNKDKKRLTIAGIQYMLRELGKKAGVQNTHPHRFRRTIATDLLSKGMPIEQVKEFLGHEKLDTTMIYCTVKEEQVKSSHRKCA